MSNSAQIHEITEFRWETRADVENLVIVIVRKQLDFRSQQVTLDTRFESLDFDSLDLAEVFFSLEDALCKTIPLERGVRVQTVGEVVDLVLKFVGPTARTKKKAAL